MTHRERYTEHRPVRSCLTSHVGRAPVDGEAIERLVDEARRAGVIVFLADDLKRMPWGSAEIIRMEHNRLHRGRR